ncbi:MAG: hypothetical protein PVG39_00470 [Desulfobacteraceae bacterium]|jgi:hypothetical protein
MQIPKPKRLPTERDYVEIIHKCKLAMEQLKPDGNCCAVCGDNDHQAWECHFNPLSIDYQAQHYRCFHCGDIILGGDQKSGEAHFGSKDQILPKCAGIDALGWDNLINILSNLPATWYPALIIHMIKVAHQKNVFKPLGATRLARKTENKIKEGK